MEFISQVLDFLLHIDTQIAEISQTYKVWTYLILFLIIFAETGLVIFPFLPGDPLLFAAGAVVATGETGINIYLLALVLFIAAIIGNQVNYTIGGYTDSKIFKPGNRFLKPSYYAKTKLFFRKHGGKAVVFSRFFPVLRTFVPFVAGVGKMDARLFVIYNITGAFVWIAGFLALGYLFGNLTVVKENFAIVVGAVSVFTTLPPIVAAIAAKFSKKQRKLSLSAAYAVSNSNPKK
ncbi:VTT domain-containing protein [Paradesertivirga mongoliensis]|uniref:VTT domain-containing protein n=1 Tax=Paradesertivirga mongoliensis TaxID=2100740 RepID=A0ABW4ZNY7_9SPHI|nr:VTT domain-containing protein [Pedobacter mongoliensis]